MIYLESFETNNLRF